MRNYLMENKEKNRNIINFKVKENKGNIPYILIWISLDGRLKTEDYSTYKEAIKSFKKLKILGRTPTIFLNLNPDWFNK